MVPIVVINDVSPSMPLFWIPHFNNTKSMFIQYFNFVVFVINPTKSSLCNHMSQVKYTVGPVSLLAHMGFFY